MLFPIIILGVILYFVFFNKKGKTISFTGNSAEETLRERYANGEIDEETFRRMKETLSK